MEVKIPIGVQQRGRSVDRYLRLLSGSRFRLSYARPIERLASLKRESALMWKGGSSRAGARIVWRWSEAGGDVSACFPKSRTSRGNLER